MLLCLVLGICLGLTSALDKQSQASRSNDEESYYPNLNFSDTFDWKLLKEFASKHKNVLLSPISLKLILALLYQGSSGPTEREFQNVLQFVDKKSVDDVYSAILSSIQASERSEYLLNMGTSIFLDSQIPPNPNFELKASQHYRTEIKPVKFADSLNATTVVNSWVEKVTNGKVTKIVTPDDLQQTIMLITNALYFKGTWRHQFPKNQTYFGKFVVNYHNVHDIETVTVPYMFTIDTFYIKESQELDAKILRLPYKGSSYSMFIILPNSIGGLPSLLKKINLNSISSLLFSMEKRLVEVNIPKFKFSFKTKMADALYKFGLRQMFENTASFTGITKGNNTLLRMLVVSDIVQKTGIELDEEGSVVYSATDVNIGNKFGEPREVFYATHPFLFFIEGPNGSVLFNGKIENPLQTEDSAVSTNLAGVETLPSTNPVLFSLVVAQVFSTPKQIVASNQNVASTFRPNFANFQNIQSSVINNLPNLEPSGTELATPEMEELLYRFNLFDMELLSEFSDSNTNVFISPASVKVTLAMVLEGARGVCAEEIGEALRIPNINERGVRNVLMGLLTSLKERSYNTFLESANTIFVSNKYKLFNKYQEVISKFYGGTANSVSFKNVGNAVNSINNWVSAATHNAITEIVGPRIRCQIQAFELFLESISPETTAVILNALYFKGKWKTAFDSQITKTKCFRTVNGCIPTPMMRASSNFNYNYISRLRVHAVEIPYEENFSMLILLPSEEAHIRSVIRDLAHFKLGDVLSKLKSSDITLEIPKFAFDYSADLVEYLKQLRIREIFGPQANLSGIVENGNVLINSLVHKTRIEVDEQGTVAAAATGAIVIPLMGSTAIIADRPFIFFIYHQKNWEYHF
ncbi:hypothetical protein NQ315_010324 [Exocentrus adspersus]|uniref:Serpin domain-containing protein n=1 Tax=Exocentrus adspersus TaxID=1586481 RepID=A0AAV8WB11_9CUCU|nr:hypothetical protein NQ315_010324 [Exocentrus adspersus]